MSDDTFSSIFREVGELHPVVPTTFTAEEQQAYYDRLIGDEDIDGEELIPVRNETHGLRYVSLRRLRPGGDMHGTLELEDITE